MQISCLSLAFFLFLSLCMTAIRFFFFNKLLYSTCQKEHSGIPELPNFFLSYLSEPQQVLLIYRHDRQNETFFLILLC